MRKIIEDRIESLSRAINNTRELIGEHYQYSNIVKECVEKIIQLEAKREVLREILDAIK